MGLRVRQHRDLYLLLTHDAGRLLRVLFIQIVVHRVQEQKLAQIIAPQFRSRFVAALIVPAVIQLLHQIVLDQRNTGTSGA